MTKLVKIPKNYFWNFHINETNKGFQKFSFRSNQPRTLVAIMTGYKFVEELLKRQEVIIL